MKIYKIIGLMSGTSLDGLDLAYCHIWKEKNTWKFNIKATKTVSYTSEMESKLKNSILLSASDLLEFHNSYGTWLGQQTKDFINEKKLIVDYIASHGHTTHHQPKKGFTFQIGSGQHIANETEIEVISDFRTNDVALDGQGAPLVPIGDLLFFNDYDFCLNLGGISNISFDINDKRIAYDIGLANMALNYITKKINLAYDNGGQLAKKGTLNKPMLNALNDLEFYKLPFPKSIGYEWFINKVVPIIDNTNDTTENLLHTTIHHITDKIAEQVLKNTSNEQSNLLITGGGALNTFLINTLQDKLGKKVNIIIPSKKIIDFKEALIFALMGVLRIKKQTNVLCSVTGAKRNSSSGVIYISS
ncbi:anhydro-N-acetylmuramic acid kinase [Cellulophaga baltica]|uniref:anhydro-N-acetylmuramic acid kinase n=1 Tax=Cellulophaga TaxID=104264 RepID=UPI001C075E55|nr:MULTISPECIES: anhydro-N-acetylmuramic acid kinase [Cellulophaga]MBU2996484.1 anhydro-N-acetylmuramic acid kinase [Cellulophaga baltica]MDO6767878.1 anhydro-N-acetylmuramic acid kinase [Cellulophaga sp. 1_MG-2023]